MSAMEDQKSNPRSGEAAGSRRQMRRLPVAGLLVALDAPDVSEDPWVVDAIDVNSRGMGLVLPPELIPGTRVGLSCKLGEGCELSRLPATVLHARSDNVGAVGFEPWPSSERIKLLEYLVSRYEQSTG